MKKSRIVKNPFKLFRYQILPLSDDFQLSIDSDISTIEELKEHKNEFFLESLKTLSKFSYSRLELAHKKLVVEEELIILRFGHKKFINVSDKEFKKKQIEDWPNVFIIINNNPKVQIAAIREDRRVFNNTETVAKIIEENLSRILKRFNLGVYFEPLYEENKFWEVIDRYPTTIVQVGFELISPNLSNISSTLKIDLDKLRSDTNTHKTDLELNSSKDSNLTINKNNELINSLVEYSAAGGGNASIRVRGLKRKIKTNQYIKEITIDDIILENIESEDSIKYLKRILE